MAESFLPAYGTQTVRQEKLLQGLMKEIVRLTTQKRPLEVGLPLYPFSHTTVFASPTIPLSDAPMAPLPNPSSLGQAGGSVYSGTFEMYSRSTALSSVPSPSYRVASTSNEMHTGAGQNDSAVWNCLR